MEAIKKWMRTTCTDNQLQYELITGLTHWQQGIEVPYQPTLQCTQEQQAHGWRNLYWKDALHGDGECTSNDSGVHWASDAVQNGGQHN
jgi:hypothetical protein